MKRVSPGTPLRIQARDWNALAEAAEAHEEARHDRGPGRRPASPNSPATVRVHNATAVTVPAGGVLVLTEPIVQPHQDPDGFPLGRPLMHGRGPQETDAGGFVVTLNACASGEIVDAAVVGLVAAQVWINDESDRFADCREYDVTSLASRPSGPAEIVWKQIPANRPNPPRAWCLVRIGGAGGGGTLPGIITGPAEIEDPPNPPLRGVRVRTTDENGLFLPTFQEHNCRVAAYDSSGEYEFGHVPLGADINGTPLTVPYLVQDMRVRIGLVNGRWWLTTPNWVIRAC